VHREDQRDDPDPDCVRELLSELCAKLLDLVLLLREFNVHVFELVNLRWIDNLTDQLQSLGHSLRVVLEVDAKNPCRSSVVMTMESASPSVSVQRRFNSSADAHLPLSVGQSQTLVRWKFITSRISLVS
jgi:hypothetical protein